MINLKILESLPNNYRHEKKFLIINNLNSSRILSQLSDSEINQITKINPLCTRSRLIKIKAIASLVNELNLSTSEASLLLHCGISTSRSLSLLNPYELKERIGRLERILKLGSKSELSLDLLKKWINSAKKITKQ